MALTNTKTSWFFNQNARLQRFNSPIPSNPPPTNQTPTLNFRPAIPHPCTALFQQKLERTSILQLAIYPPRSILRGRFRVHCSRVQVHIATARAVARKHTQTHVHNGGDLQRVLSEMSYVNGTALSRNRACASV